jgi:hypothetical protein
MQKSIASMKRPFRAVLTLGFLLAYLGTSPRAIGQGIDTFSQISNQVDANVVETLTTPSYQSPGAVTYNPETGGAQPGNTPGIYSGYGQKGKWDFLSNVGMIETFNEKNSFTGKGVTDLYSSQLGFTIASPIGTKIQPYISYQHTSTDLVGTNSAHANTYGASLNITQKIFPAVPVFCDDQPNAVYNIPTSKPDQQCDATTWKDHYPNFDIVAGLNLSYGDANLSTLGKGWKYDTQDSYGITPNLSFDLYRKKSATEGGFDFLPNAISIVPSYAYNSTDGHSGESSSSGLLSIQDRNSYLFVCHHKDDCDSTPDETIQIIQSNTLFHDTNQEPIAAPTGPIAYQNWARFGFAIQYGNTMDSHYNLPVAKIEYDYDAFNAQYQAHTVLLTVNFRFW